MEDEKNNIISGEETDVSALSVEDRIKRAERSIVKKYRKEIWTKFTKAINTYDLIQDGDRIACCISGGKDSMLLAKLFQELKRHGKKNFEVIYLSMDPGYNEANKAKILENAKLLGIPLQSFESDIFDSVSDFDLSSACYLCARMRRGSLYSRAGELGCNKIALGHHYDDVIETILLGMFYGGQMQSMMPKLHSTNFEGMELIRPMYLIREESIKNWRDYNKLTFLQCACRFTEAAEASGTAHNSSKRAEVKSIIRELKKLNPIIEKNIFRSAENVQLDTLIEYRDSTGRHNFLDTYNDKAGKK